MTTLFDQIGVIVQTCGLIISFITKAVGGFINDVAAISPFGLLTAWIPQFWILILENVLFCCFLLNQSKGLMIQTQIFVDMSFPLLLEEDLTQWNPIDLVSFFLGLSGAICGHEAFAWRIPTVSWDQKKTTRLRGYGVLGSLDGEEKSVVYVKVSGFFDM